MSRNFWSGVLAMIGLDCLAFFLYAVWIHDAVGIVMWLFLTTGAMIFSREVFDPRS